MLHSIRKKAEKEVDVVFMIAFLHQNAHGSERHQLYCALPPFFNLKEPPNPTQPNPTKEKPKSENE
ncbi:hypothetical protein AKJ16_DCAP03061 [Drosera capensis]